MAERATAMASIWKMENSNMLLAPESPNIRRNVEGNREPPDASPPMENGRRRGSNSRLPSLATLVRKSI